MITMNSKQLIGDVKDHYDMEKNRELLHPVPDEMRDWHFYYNGWLEGRLELMMQIRRGEIKISEVPPNAPARDDVKIVAGAGREK